MPVLRSTAWNNGSADPIWHIIVIQIANLGTCGICGFQMTRVYAGIPTAIQQEVNTDGIHAAITKNPGPENIIQLLLEAVLVHHVYGRPGRHQADQGPGF